ncbi:FecCD family ABC transporter permease [Micromonospora sp. BQ11]
MFPAPVARLAAEPQGLRQRRAGGRRLAVVCLVLAGAVLLLGVGAITQGVPDVEVRFALDAVAGRAGDDVTAYLVRQNRLPRVVAALACGAALGGIGVLLQDSLRNPIAEPGLLGVAHGASLVVTLQVLFGVSLPGVARPVACLLGGLAAGALLLAVNRRITDPVRLVLTGFALATLFSAVISAALVLAPSTGGQTQATVNRYLSGSLSGLAWPEVRVLLLWVGAGLPVALLLGRVLNLLQLGDDTAAGLGVHVGRTRLGLLVLAMVLLAPVVAVAGPLSFVGLLAAHVARGLLGSSDSRQVLPVAVLAGALVTLIADQLGRLAFEPLEIPAGIWTVLVGGPLAIVVATRAAAQRRAAR